MDGLLKSRFSEREWGFLFSASKALIFALLLVNFQACILPLPNPYGKDKYSEEDISAITRGLSNKSDVVAKFGEPDLISKLQDSEEVFIYKWTRRRFTLIFVGPGVLGGAPLESDEALLILFDDKSTVKKIGKSGPQVVLDDDGFGKQKVRRESYDEFLNRWLKSKD